MTGITSTLKVHDDELNRGNDASVNGPAPGIEAGALRRVPDRIPWVVLLILNVELGERFTHFGLSAPIQNYIKYVPNKGRYSYGPCAWTISK